MGQATSRAALLFLLSTGAGAAGGGAPARDRHRHPRDGATIGLGANPEKSVEIALTVANFKPQRQCGGAANCGHIVGREACP
jgi:hypothetical protein